MKDIKYSCDKCKRPYKIGLIDGQMKLDLTPTLCGNKLQIKYLDEDGYKQDYCLRCLIKAMVTFKELKKYIKI